MASVPERMPRFLICMPVLNRAWIVRYSLGSIVSQDYPKELVRVVVVDGGSTDGTPEVAEEVLKASGVRYEVIVARSNVAEARNICIDSLRDEDLVLMWEIDNIASRSLLTALSRAASTTGYGVLGVAPSFLSLRSEEEVEGVFKEVVGASADSIDGVRVVPAYHVPGAFLCIRRDVVERGLRFSKKVSFYDDVDFCRRAIEAGICVGRVEGVAAVDIDIARKAWSDIYADMPLKRYAQGMASKAKGLAYLAAFEKRVANITRAIYHVASAASIALTPTLVYNPYLGSIALALWLLLSGAYIGVHIKRGYSPGRALKKLAKVQIVSLPMHLLTILFYLRYRVASYRYRGLLERCGRESRK